MPEETSESRLFDPCHRRLQTEYGTKDLADRQEALIVHDQLLSDEIAFIESRDMVFLSTVGPSGQPTVSYKGGAPGFIKVSNNELVLPCYNGNGMYLSMGNVDANPKVGLLFIDFETPRRLRVHGIARHSTDTEGLYPGAEFITRISPLSIFVNCPRYIHRYQRVAPSRYVPDAEGGSPLAMWKRLHVVADVLPEHDRIRAEAEGLISIEDYDAAVAEGAA